MMGVIMSARDVYEQIMGGGGSHSGVIATNCGLTMT